MMTHFRRQWHTLKSSRPGHRFQDRYKREHKKGNKEAKWKHIAIVVGGLALSAAGIVFLVIPGPGLPLLFVGGALLAGRSWPIAVGFDWTEVKIRQVYSWSKHAWQRASTVSKTAIVTGATAIAVSSLYAGYRFVF